LRDSCRLVAAKKITIFSYLLVILQKKWAQTGDRVDRAPTDRYRELKSVVFGDFHFASQRR
jgi:ABC-type siderophore export system fused ATPase/permease subunit